MINKRKFNSEEEEKVYWGDKSNQIAKLSTKKPFNVWLSKTAGIVIAALVFIIIILLLIYGGLLLISCIRSLWISLYILNIL